MISLFFVLVGIWLGWWVRGTKVGTWIKNAFTNATE